VDQSVLSDLFVPGVSIAEKILRPIVIYLFLVVLLRLGGRRELAQMNAFDLVVLLMLANAVQNAIIGDDNSLLGGIIGGTTLIALNQGINWYLYRHPKVDRRIEGDPTHLVKDGKLLHHNLKKELITEQELLAMIRRQGVDSVDACSEVTLETSGVISVIQKQPSESDLANQAMMERLERIEARLERLLAGGAAPDDTAAADKTTTAAVKTPAGGRQARLSDASPSDGAHGGQDTPHTRRPPFTPPADGDSA
jgi:uncharacterized membrane protein YcaP (DUF421 family)